MNCHNYRTVIERILEGDCSTEQLDQFRGHCRCCDACKRRFSEIGRMGHVLQDAFASTTSATDGLESTLSRIAQIAPLSSPVHPLRRWMSIAAMVLVTTGLVCGFGLGRLIPMRPASGPVPDRAPISVAQVQGTVLVRHEDTDQWVPLRHGAATYAGDMFHCLPKASLVLAVEGIGLESRVTLQPGSTLVLLNCRGQLEFYLEHGIAAAVLDSPHTPFFVSTPNGRVEALGTEFTISVDE